MSIDDLNLPKPFPRMSLDDIAEALSHNLPVRPTIQAGFNELLKRINLPEIRLVTVAVPYPQAAYYPMKTQPMIAVTQGLLDMLGDREVMAVLSHELKHIRDEPLVYAAAITSGAVPAGITYTALKPATTVKPPVLQVSRRELVTAGAAIAGAAALKNPVMQHFEHRADAASLEYLGDAKALQSAYRKIERWSRQHGYTDHADHGTMSERIRRLESLSR